MKLAFWAAILTAFSAASFAATGEYTIRKGDTAVWISRSHGLSLEEFRRLNPDLNFYRLPVGGRVRVAEIPAPVPAVPTQSGQRTDARPLETGDNAGSQPAEPPRIGDTKTNPQTTGAALEWQGSAQTSPAVSALRVIGALIFVAALAYLSLLALKGTMARKAGGTGRRSLRVIETVALGANRTLHVVEVGGKRMLIGSTPGQMSMLAEIEGGIEADAPAEETGFDSILRRLAPDHDRARSANRISRMIREGADFLRSRREAVRTMSSEADTDAQ